MKLLFTLKWINCYCHKYMKRVEYCSLFFISLFKVCLAELSLWQPSEILKTLWMWFKLNDNQDTKTWLTSRSLLVIKDIQIYLFSHWTRVSSGLISLGWTQQSVHNNKKIIVKRHLSISLRTGVAGEYCEVTGGLLSKV